MRVVIGLLLVALSGCAPVVLQQSPTSVVIKHGNSMPGVTDALIEANKVCGTYGKTAVMDVTRCPGQCLSQYICQ